LTEDEERFKEMNEQASRHALPTRSGLDMQILTMNTRRGLAFVDFNIAIITSVAVLAVTSVSINFILTGSF